MLFVCVLCVRLIYAVLKTISFRMSLFLSKPMHTFPKFVAFNADHITYDVRPQQCEHTSKATSDTHAQGTYTLTHIIVHLHLQHRRHPIIWFSSQYLIEHCLLMYCANSFWHPCERNTDWAPLPLMPIDHMEVGTIRFIHLTQLRFHTSHMKMQFSILIIIIMLAGWLTVSLLPCCYQFVIRYWYSICGPIHTACWLHAYLQPLHRGSPNTDSVCRILCWIW